MGRHIPIVKVSPFGPAEIGKGVQRNPLLVQSILQREELGVGGTVGVTMLGVTVNGELVVNGVVNGVGVVLVGVGVGTVPFTRLRNSSCKNIKNPRKSNPGGMH